MPTESQLDIILESQLEFFGGSGLPKHNFEGNSDGYGHTDDKFVDVPQSIHNGFYPLKGKIIGHIIVDPETKELEIKITT